jgi:hypothetical protein
VISDAGVVRSDSELAQVVVEVAVAEPSPQESIHASEVCVIGPIDARAFTDEAGDE